VCCEPYGFDASGEPIGGTSPASRMTKFAGNLTRNERDQHGDALNAAFTGAVRSTLVASPDLVDPRRHAPARNVVAAPPVKLLGVVSRRESRAARRLGS
jgi:hypothetical protein